MDRRVYPMMTPWRAWAGGLCLTLLLSACTSDQRYGAVQTWQRQQCLKINDEGERRRCLQQADTSRERYEQQRQQP